MNSATVKIAKNFPYLSCKNPNFLVDERKVLYLTVPPRFRYPHLHSRIHKIHDTTLFNGIDYMAVFMKTQTVGSKRCFIQFNSPRIRRLFWEYCFMERREPFDTLLREEISKLPPSGTHLESSTIDSPMNIDSENFDSIDSPMNIDSSNKSHLDIDMYSVGLKKSHNTRNRFTNSSQVDINRKNSFSSHVTFEGITDSNNEFSIYESDLSFFRNIYKKYNWQPSYVLKPKTIYWEGYPIYVSTGSIVTFPKHTFNLVLKNIPSDCQEWMIDEWFRDALKDATHVNHSHITLNPKIRRRVIHLEEGGQSTNTASLNVGMNLKQIQEEQSNLEKVADLLSKLPIQGEYIQVEIQASSKTQFLFTSKSY